MNAVLKFEKPRVSNSQINKVCEFKKLDSEIKRLEKIKDELKKDIIKNMGNNTEILNESRHVIATLTEKIRTGIDSKKLKENYNDAYMNCLKTTQYKEFRAK